MRFKFVALLIFFGSLGLFHGQSSTDEIELDDVPEQILDKNASEERKMDSLLNSIKETDDVIFPKTFPENYKNKYLYCHQTKRISLGKAAKKIHRTFRIYFWKYQF